MQFPITLNCSRKMLHYSKVPITVWMRYSLYCLWIGVVDIHNKYSYLKYFAMTGVIEKNDKKKL